MSICKLLTTTSVFSLIAIFCTAADAQTVPDTPPSTSFMQGFQSGHPYVGVAGAASFINPVKGYAPALGASAREHWNPGFAVGGLAGWAFSNGLMFDVAGIYASATADRITGIPVKTQQKGRQKTGGFLVEGYYMLPFHTKGILPYIGAGVGPFWTRIDAPVTFPDGSVNRPHGTTGANFTYEAVAGLAFPLKAIPHAAMVIDYRWVGLVDARSIQQDYTPADGGPSISGPLEAQHHIGANIVAVGFAYNF